MASIQPGLQLPRGLEQDLESGCFDDLELTRERQRVKIHDRGWHLVYRLTPTALLALLRVKIEPWDAGAPFAYYRSCGFRLRRGTYAEFLLEHETVDTLPGGFWETAEPHQFTIGSLDFSTGQCSSTFHLALGCFLRGDDYYGEDQSFWTLKVRGASAAALPEAVETALLFLGRRGEEWRRWPRLHTVELSTDEVISASRSRRKQAKNVLAADPLAYYNRAMALSESARFYDLAYLELLKALECIGGIRWENQLRQLRSDAGVSDNEFVRRALAHSSRNLQSLLSHSLRPVWRGHTVTRVRKALADDELRLCGLIDGLVKTRNKVAHSGWREKEMEVPFSLRDWSELENWCRAAKLLTERAIDVLLLT